MKTIFIVRNGAPALNFIKRELISRRLKHGQIILASDEEIESWRDDVDLVHLHSTQPGSCELSLPENIPREVCKAAAVVSDWITENDIKNWMIGGLTSVRND